MLCSALCARELPGYGFNGRLTVRRESNPLEDVALKLRFFDYSSEAHLQNGLLCFEESGGVFCSANLMLLTGSGARKIIGGSCKAVLDGVFTDRVPKKVPLALIKKKPAVLTPKIAAVDNGFCVKV